MDGGRPRGGWSIAAGLLVAVFVFGAPRAEALPLVLEWAGSAAGTLNGRSFQESESYSFKIIFRIDTDAVEHTSDQQRRRFTGVGSAEITGPSFGDAIIAATVTFFSSYPLGFSNSPPEVGLGITYPAGGGKSLFEFKDNALQGWSADTNIGPLFQSDIDTNGQFVDVPLDRGTLDIASFHGVNFTARLVPEPSTDALLAFGVLALAWRRSRRARGR